MKTWVIIGGWIIFCFLFEIKLHAQDQLQIAGYIYDEDGKLENAIIEVSRDSIKLSEQHSDEDGKFFFKLDFGGEFILSFRYPGYSPKKVLINTHLPEEKDPEQHQLISLRLELIQQYGNSYDRGILGEVKFSRVTKEFAYESKYDANAFLNIQISGIDYYLSQREEELLKEGELKLLEFDLELLEEDKEDRKEDYYDYILSEREKFLGEKIDSFEFEELPVKEKKMVFDTTINSYSRYRMHVTEIIINTDKILRVYHQVKHSWGPVFYFKNYVPISKTQFHLETLFDE